MIENKEESKESLTYLFFRNDANEPWKDDILDNNPWAPYDLEDQIEILKSYSVFESKNKSEEYSIHNLQRPSEYLLNFSLNIQIHQKDNFRIRKVIREFPNNFSFIKRNDRFYNYNNIDQDVNNDNKRKYKLYQMGFLTYDNLSECRFSNKQDINQSLNIKYRLNFGDFNQETILKSEMKENKSLEYDFEIIEGLSIKISLNQNIYNINTNVSNQKILENLNFENLINSIKDEITYLGDKMNKKKSAIYYNYKLSLMENNINFFEKFLNLFTLEGFLYKTYNEILRNEENDELKKIKYLDLAFKVCFKYLSLNEKYSKVNNNKYNITFPNNNNIIKSNTNDIVIYAIINEDEIIDIEKNNNLKDEKGYRILKERSKDDSNKKIIPIIRIAGYLSTQTNEESIKKFLNLDYKYEIEYLHVIKIPEYMIKYESDNFLSLESISEFKNEKEILLKENSFLIIDETKKYEGYDNKYIRYCTLISLTIRSYLNLILHNNNFSKKKNIKINKELNLSNNREFLSDNHNVLYLENYMLKENEKINVINLSNNQIGITNKFFKNKDINSIEKNNLSSNIDTNNIDENHNNFYINNQDIDKLIEENFRIFKFIGKIFSKKNFNLITLNLSHNLIGLNFENMNSIRDIIFESETIKELYLGGNFLGRFPDNMRIIKEIFSNKKINLEYLDLSKNNFDFDIQNIIYLRDGLIENPKLKEINLTNNMLGANLKNLEIIQEIFEENTNLTMINLSKNKLGIFVENVITLKKIILNNRNLEKICLLKNEFPNYIEDEIRSLSNIFETISIFI